MAKGVTESIELENIPIALHKYEYDGYGNNDDNPTWGTSYGTRVRILPNEDGFFQRPGVPRSELNDGLPSARRIMEELFTLPALKTKKASASTNDFKLNFGMIMHSDSLHAGKNDSEPFDLTGDGNFSDAVYCPVTGQFETKQDYAKSFSRYQHELVPDKNNISELIRATKNGATAIFDLGCIYGESEEENAAIRDPNDKRLFHMVDTGKGLFPKDPYIRDCFGTVPTAYVSHVLWMRLHNHVAPIIVQQNSTLDDEQVFQAARNFVIATYQKILITKYVPSLLGDSMGEYPGYDKTMDPSIDEYFAAITYRYGHSEQPHVIRLADEDFLPTSRDPILMRDAYRKNPQAIVERIGGIEDFIRGAVVSPTKPFDYSFENDLNFYSKATTMVDVQRARDVGIPPYNQVRRNLGLEPVGSIRELVEANGYNSTNGYDSTELVQVLENLYDNDIEKVDSYVGTLFEAPIEKEGVFGPSLTKSAKDQFNRIRTGDQYWFENVYTESEIAALPSMTDVVKLVCKGMDKFPETFFRVYGFGGGNEECQEAQKGGQVALLGGDVIVEWMIVQNPSEGDDEEAPSTIELTHTANAEMEGAGYLGIGWRSQKMAGADIWFCTVDDGAFGQLQKTNNCERQTSPMFSCCLASGANVKPQCFGEGDPRYYKLDVVSWCLSNEESSVTISALVCDEKTTSGCFDLSSNPDGTIDMIASFNPTAKGAHGFRRRTATVVDLKLGILTAAEAGVASEGLIAYHGLSMLVFWLILAPLAIYIVRYKKTKSWRLTTHISIMGAVGGLTIPIIVGIESAVGASSDKTQEHSLIGIVLTFLILPMFIAGRIRYSKLQGYDVGRRAANWAFIFHKFFGYGILLFAWWNCYTGLVRISPADSFFQLVVLSSFPFGYEIPIFGIIKDSVYWPYLSVVVCIFVYAEIRKWLLEQKLGANQSKEASKTIWDDGSDGSANTYEEMERGKFIELVKLGTPLCIIDSHVLDLTGFLEHHPGGSDMLEGVAGTDISAEVRGKRAIEGFQHKHSYMAVQKMKSMVIATLVADVNEENSGLPTIGDPAPHTMMERQQAARDVETSDGATKRPESRVFRRARIVYTTFITPSHEITADNKPVILLCLAAPKRPDFGSDGSIIPSSAYRFRITNPWGTTFESYYTPVSLRENDSLKKAKLDMDDDEELLQFLISIRPGGQLEKACMSWKLGKTLPVIGPTVNPKVLQRISSTPPSHTVILFASGTGIAPMLQLLDFYSPKRSKNKKEPPHIFLIWLLKNPQHNYNEWIGLEDIAKTFKSKFRWVVLYSMSKSKATTEPPRARKRSSIVAPRRNRTERLGDMRCKDDATFQNRLKDGVVLDSSRRSQPVEESTLESEGVETLLVNDVFWSVHGNKCISLKLNEEVVSKLVSATEAEVKTAKSKGSKMKLFAEKTEEESVGLAKKMVAYVCGSPGFDECVRDWLLNSDFPSENITHYYSSPTVHI